MSAEHIHLGAGKAETGPCSKPFEFGKVEAGLWPPLFFLNQMEFFF